MAKFQIFVLIAVITVTFPISVSASLIGSSPFWNGLRTTFAPDGVISWVPGYKSTGYAPVPRTVSDAVSQNWVNTSSTCDNGGVFSGFRYVYQTNATHNDTSVSPLFNVNGVIAGIQMNILVSEAKADPNNTYEFHNIPMFVRNTISGNDVYTLTAYFVDPATICDSTKARSASDLSVNGTGTAVSFQNGPDPSTLINAPSNRTIALAEGWSNNNCFPGMGVHNWYQQEQFQATLCNTIRPVFLLYTKQNQLLGFGFQHVGKSYSPRYEHPPGSVVKMIVGDDVSPCLIEKANTVGVTTMHVFLINNPLSQTCIV